MKQINYGKIIGEVGFDYLITGCVESVDMLPQQALIATRYYVGAEVPRSVYHYDGSTWINEGTKYIGNPEDSDQLDVYKLEMNINEELAFNGGNFMAGYGWTKNSLLSNVEGRGKPVKLFGYVKCRVTELNNGERTEELCIANFSATEYDSSLKKTVNFYANNLISYANTANQGALFMLSLENSDIEITPNNYNEANIVLYFPKTEAILGTIKLLNIDLTILYNKQ